MKIRISMKNIQNNVKAMKFELDSDKITKHHPHKVNKNNIKLNKL